MRVSELTKMLMKNNCELVGHGTRHDKWYSHITGNYFRVPRHKGQEVPKGTLDSILKDAGLK